jgi:hypothetical protein
MTEVVEKARKRLAELEAEADKIRTFLGVYAELEGGNLVDTVSGEVADGDDSETASPAEIVEAAKALMRERGRPLSRSKIVRMLTKQGLVLPGQDKAKNVGTVIWRSKQFDNIAGHGYWPREFGRWIGQGPPKQAELLGDNISELIG